MPGQRMQGHVRKEETKMIPLLCISVGLMLLGIAFLCYDAPEGYQDNTGFHYGKPQQKEQKEQKEQK